MKLWGCKTTVAVNKKLTLCFHFYDHQTIRSWAKKTIAEWYGYEDDNHFCGRWETKLQAMCTKGQLSGRRLAKLGGMLAHCTRLADGWPSQPFFSHVAIARLPVRIVPCKHESTKGQCSEEVCYFSLLLRWLVLPSPDSLCLKSWFLYTQRMKRSPLTLQSCL